MSEVPNTPGPSAHQLFTILAREHADMLITYIRSVVRDANVAEDLFQETMLVAWRKLADSDQTLPFGPWLRGIAGKLILEHRRKAAARATLACTPELLDALESEFSAFEQRPGDTFRSRAERLLTCLEHLPALMRDAVHLVYARGLSLQALATSLGATQEAVKKRVQRARQLLAECLESSGNAA
jgi:RNA polymerase sigma-70 factor (ECF subfamily)